MRSCSVLQWCPWLQSCLNLSVRAAVDARNLVRARQGGRARSHRDCAVPGESLFKNHIGDRARV
eukprot:6200992-Pleurochrysis_carterae.AAC.1